MNFGGARPEVGKKTASRHEVLARAAADRAERAAARERDTAAVILQSWHRGFAAALLARATQLRAFDARLQSTARLKQQLPSGTQLPLPPLCLLARSLAFVLTGRGSSRINNGSLIMASDGALTGAAAVKLRATLSLLLPTLNSATNIPDVQEPEVNTSPADRKASEAASGVPRTLSRMALLAVRLLAAETISRSEAGENSAILADSALADIYRGRGEGSESSREEEEEESAKFSGVSAHNSAASIASSPAAAAAATSGNSAASEGKWGGDLPMSFVLALLPRLGTRTQQQLLTGLHHSSVAGGARGGSLSSITWVSPSALACRPSLLRATVAAMADIVRSGTCSSSGSSKSVSSHAGQPAVEEILSSVSRRRLGDLFLLSCTALIHLSRTDATNGASSLAPEAPEVNPSALAWADAVLCLHPRLVALAVPFGFLAAAANTRCPWLWSALERIHWPALAEDSRPSTPTGLLIGPRHHIESESKSSSTAAAKPRNAGATSSSSSSPLEEVFTTCSRRLRVRRVCNARDLAVTVATARVVNVAGSVEVNKVDTAQATNVRTLSPIRLPHNEREAAAAAKLLGEALLSRAQLCLQRGQSAAAWHDCCRALDLTSVATMSPDLMDSGHDVDADGTGSAEAAEAMADRLAQVRRAAGLRRALSPLAVSARRLRAQVMAPFAEAGTSPQAAAARLADLRAAAAVPASVVGREVRRACRLELEVAEAAQAEIDKAARKVTTKANRQAQAIAREAKKAGRQGAAESSSSSSSEDDEDTKAQAEAKRVRRRAKRERAAERERAQAADEKAAQLAARASTKAATEAQRASQDARLLATAQRHAQAEVDALAAAQLAHRITSMRVGEAESSSAADAAKTQANAAAALEAEAKRLEQESAARVAARAAEDKATARAREEAAVAEREALAEQQRREEAAQRRKDRRAAKAAAAKAAAAAAGEASATQRGAGVSPPAPPVVGLSQASLGDRWWGAIEDDDPISMEPIAELKYPPFDLKELPEEEDDESNAQGGPGRNGGGAGGAGGGGGRQGEARSRGNEKKEGSESGGSGSDVKFWFDGRLLAHWLVSTGTFLHPTTRQPVSRRTCARLDTYLARHRLVKQPAVVKMFDLCAPSQGRSSALPSDEADGATSDGSGDRERRRLAVTTREALRRDASRLLEQFFAGGGDDDDVMQGRISSRSGSGSGSGHGGGLVDDDDGDASLADESAAAARRAHARSQRFLLHSTLDFPALPVAAPPLPPPPPSNNQTLQASSPLSQPAAEVGPMSVSTSVSALGAGAAANATPLYANLTHWLDAADLHASGGVRALESALAAFAPGVACALVPLSLWRSLSTMFPRRYSLATPEAASRFLVVDDDVAFSGSGGGGFNGGGCPQVLDHLKHFASKVVTNDATGRCHRMLLAESALALRDANAAFIACRTQPYLLAAGSAFVLL